MRMGQNENIVQQKSYEFALRVVRLHTYLNNEKKEYIISNQLFRAGTSIGANLAEAKYAQSRADFISKCHIALKESSESSYWISLLHDSDILSDTEYDSISQDLNELLALLTSIVKTSKKSQEKNS